MSSFTISVPDELRVFVEQQVRMLGLRDADAFFHALLEEARSNVRSEALDRRLVEGLEEGGDDIAVNAEFWLSFRQQTSDRIAAVRNETLG